MAEPDEFWQSGLPFISDSDGKRVDWGDVGAAAVGTIATSFFASIADLVESLWESIVVSPFGFISTQLSLLVAGTLEQVRAGIAFGTGAVIGSDPNFLVSAAIVAIGGYLLAVILGRVI
jgi:hypothetical protein